MGKIRVEDKSSIKKINLLYPNIMSENAEDIIKNIYNREVQIKDKLWELRQEIYSLEGELKELQKFKSSIQDLYTIEYDIKEIDEIKNEVFLYGGSKDDARHKRV